MKKIFVLLTIMLCSSAFAVNPDSEIGRSFIQSGMSECVETAMQSGVGLGVASDYCKCTLNKTLIELSMEQLSEYYQHGREIETIMERNAKECMATLLKQTDSKEQLISMITEGCVEGAVNSGARIGLASEYCKCVSEKMIEKLTVEQIMEYYNNGREIEDLAKECIWMLSE